MSQHFHIHPFDPAADLLRLSHLLAAVEAVDNTGEDVSEELLQEQLTWAGHNPELDRWVVEAPDDSGELIGWCSIWKALTENTADITVAVHPHWRHRGIGSQLMPHLLRRANELETAHLRAYADISHSAGNRFLQKFGFTSVARYTEMQAILDNDEPDVPIFPNGYEVRTYAAIQNLSTLFEAFNRCYKGLWGHHETIVEEDLKNWLPELNPDGIFLLFAPDERVAGICRSEHNEHLSKRRGTSMGYIDAPGVVPEHRAEQLYLPLLLVAMRWLYEQGLRTIELESWGDAEETLALYQKASFSILHQAISYRLELMREGETERKS